MSIDEIDLQPSEPFDLNNPQLSEKDLLEFIVLQLERNEQLLCVIANKLG